MSSKINSVKLYPKIHVYKNVFDDVDEFLKKAKEATGWEQWYTFGDMLALQEQSFQFDVFPTKEQYISSRIWQVGDSNRNLVSSLAKELGEIFYDVTKDFIEMYPECITQNWIKNPASINKYIDGSGVSENYSMNYHTDFVQSEKDMPGQKYGITTTFYLNDNYDSGEICFKINDEYIAYKPEKGDVIVFPSSPPYFHAVRKAYGSDRYMARSFWQYNYNGSEEWIENQKKFGLEKWDSMEQERIKEERVTNQFPGESFHEFFGRDNLLYNNREAK